MARLGIENVSKRYRGDIWGLRDFSLDVESGVLGLIGPNGAGKSTLMRIIATITRTTGGRVVWDGNDIARKPNRIRAVLGYLPQDFGVYPHLNPVEFLAYLAAARGLSGRSARRRIEQLIEIVNLGDARKRPLGGFSGGMKQRVGIAQALLNDPQILMVDEPTAGLDPEERVRFRNLLSDLSGDRVVVLSSHIVSDIEAAATSIAIINSGRLLCHTTPEEMLQMAEGKVWETLLSSAELLAVRKEHIISGTIRTGDGVRARVVSETSPSPMARSVNANMEDAYLYILDRGRNGERV